MSKTTEPQRIGREPPIDPIPDTPIIRNLFLQERQALLNGLDLKTLVGRSLCFVSILVLLVGNLQSLEAAIGIPILVGIVALFWTVDRLRGERKIRFLDKWLVHHETGREDDFIHYKWESEHTSERSFVRSLSRKEPVLWALVGLWSGCYFLVRFFMH